MARTKSSSRWLKEHFDDPYVKRAQKEGYRSRAVYKLQELNERDRFLKPGLSVVDLGAAKILGDNGRIVAMDIFPMEPINGVQMLQGDFREQAVLDQLLALVGSDKVDLILCDMAPNMSGTDVIDHPRAMYLAELAMEFTHRVLRPEGTLVMKLFQGSGVDEFMKALRTSFTKVVFRKPKASRARSPELYVLARGYKL